MKAFFLQNYTDWYIFVSAMSKAEKTREFIIEKIAPVFNTKGYAGTSLSDMTEATGLTKGSIYGNFANKDEVALAVFDFNYRKVTGFIKSEADKKTTVKDKLLVYVSVYDNLSRDTVTKGGCPVLNTAIESDDTHTALRQRASSAVIAWKRGIAKLVEEGIAAKEFRKDINPEKVALTMIALIEGGIMIGKVTGKSSYRKLIMESVEKLVDDLV